MYIYICIYIYTHICTSDAIGVYTLYNDITWYNPIRHAVKLIPNDCFMGWFIIGCTCCHLWNLMAKVKAGPLWASLFRIMLQSVFSPGRTTFLVCSIFMYASDLFLWRWVMQTLCNANKFRRGCDAAMHTTVPKRLSKKYAFLYNALTPILATDSHILLWSWWMDGTSDFAFLFVLSRGREPGTKIIKRRKVGKQPDETQQHKLHRRIKFRQGFQ